MTKHNFKSFSFALGLLFLVLMSRDAGDTIKERPENHIENTSLTAQASDQLTMSPMSVLMSQQKNPVVQTAAVVIGPKKNIVKATPEKSQRKPSISISAHAALVKDLDTNEIIFEKNLTQRWPTASLTKLLTAVVALENLPPDQPILVTDSVLRTEFDPGGLKDGEIYSVSDLINAALVSSSNNAALAIAETHGYEQFLGLMTRKAAALGMDASNFIDPTGLSSVNQSSIIDLDKLVGYIVKNRDEIFRTTRQTKINIKDLNSGTSHAIISNNRFAGQANFLGGKTGYTDDANGNLISIFNQNKRRILIIVLGTSDRFGETEKLLKWAESVIGK